MSIETSLAVQDNGGVLARNQELIQSFMSGEFDLDSLEAAERLELMRQVMQIEAELEISSLPMANSQDIVGFPFTIHDAIFKSIPSQQLKNADGTPLQKRCVNFLLEAQVPISIEAEKYSLNLEAGEYFTCLKSSNNFNDTYVIRFQTMRGVAVMPLKDREFIINKRYAKAGNPAITIQKIRPETKTVSAKK